MEAMTKTEAEGEDFAMDQNDREIELRAWFVTHQEAGTLTHEDRMYVCSCETESTLHKTDKGSCGRMVKLPDSHSLHCCIHHYPPV